METLLTYLVQASAGIVLFYMIYWLFLKNETYHNANRWFLLTVLFSSVLLPLLPVHYTLQVEQGTNPNLFAAIPDTFKHIPAVAGQEAVTGTFNWQQPVLLVYFTGAAIFLLRLFTQTFILIHLIIKHRIKTHEGIRIVENEKYGLPFSFFNVVFINPKFHKQENLPEILAHEKVHIRENHWFDLLFTELLTVIFWFNPFIWFFERSIKQNHEYLADRGVLAQGHHVGRYQALLINQLMGMQIIGVTNNLNFALNTNRLKMMTKTKTSRFCGAKFLWALPALALLLFAFAEPDYQVSYNEPDNENVLVSDDLKSQKTIKLEGLVLDEVGEPLPGTSIVIKGTTKGTVADLYGKFQLEVLEKSSIVLSFVGKETMVEHYTQIPSGEMKEGVFHKKYVLKDIVILIGPGEPVSPPPPPPPAIEKKEKSASPTPLPADKDKELFYIVEDMPEYPGGSAVLSGYVYEMQQKIAQAEGIKGKAKVAFTVDAKGKVTDIKVVEKDNEGVVKGAIQIVSEMPDWTPGKQRGKAVPVKFLLPLEFN